MWGFSTEMRNLPVPPTRVTPLSEQLNGGTSPARGDGAVAPAVALPCLFQARGFLGWLVLPVSQSVFAPCLHKDEQGRPASRCLWVFRISLGHREMLGGAETMPWESHIPEDVEGAFSIRPWAVTCHQVT